MKTFYIISLILGIGTGLCPGISNNSDPSGTNSNPVGPRPDSLLKTVLENNRTLRSSWEAYQVAILEAGTGNTPPNPTHSDKMPVGAGRIKNTLQRAQNFIGVIP